MSEVPRRAYGRHVRRLGPLLVSGALHGLLVLGLYVLFAGGVTPPRVLVADLLELAAGGRTPAKPDAPPAAPRRLWHSARQAAQRVARTSPVDPVTNPNPPTAPAPTVGVDSQEPAAGAGAPAVDTGGPAQMGGPAGVDGPANPPRAGQRVSPTYPEHARRAAVQGTSVVIAAIRADGSVGEVRLKQSAGHPDLDAAAIDAVHRWRFAPAQRRGVAVDFCCVEIPIAFRLQ